MCFTNFKEIYKLWIFSIMCLLNNAMVLYVPDNNPSGLYDFDKYELGHKFHRIRMVVRVLCAI